MFRARPPAKPSQNVVVEAALDGQIAGQRPSGEHIGSGSFDMSHNRGQARRRGVALADLDAGAREGALHDVRAALCKPDITNPAAAGSKTTGEAENSRRASTR